MGVTGSGKTFTMANVIQAAQRPTLVMSHNKTLAAQLYSEFKEFFPHNAVHYFVSYYDYYQPEAYIPQRDIYIEKDASINQEIDRLRLAATSALVSRRDVIIVASVSCIYGLGSPSDYREMMVGLRVGQEVDRDQMLARLVDIQYERNDVAFEPGKFRVRGDCVEVFPSYEEFAMRIEFWGDEVEQLSLDQPDQRRDDPPPGGAATSTRPSTSCCPRSGSHSAVEEIRRELDERLEQFRRAGQAARGPAAQRPHPLRPGDDAGGRLLPGHRELQPPAVGPPAGIAARHALQLLPRRFPAVRRRVARHACRRSAACTPATTTAR